MLDKIYLKSKHEAHLIFDDRSPIVVVSDVDVVPLLEFLLTPFSPAKSEFNDEITLKIETKPRDAA